jgi:undecaprenyl-diphosphatase
MDAALFELLNGHGPRALDGFWLTVTTLGEGHYATLIALLLVFLAQRRARASVAVALVLSSSGVGLVVEAIKHEVDRPRPLAALGESRVHVVGEELRKRSFPSGHTACAAALCACGAGLVRTRRGWATGVTLAGLVGLSRVMVGAHFPADVAGGAVLGGFFGGGVRRLHDAALAWWRRRRGPANKVV